MKNLLFTSIFIFLSIVSAFGQNQCATIEECNAKLSQAAQMIDKLLDVEQKDAKALADLQIQVASLKGVIEALEAAKQTPCTIAQEKVKQDLTYWLTQFDGASPEKQKQIVKIIKFTRKNGQKSLQAQCGYSSKSLMETIWDGAKTAAPFAAILLAL